MKNKISSIAAASIIALPFVGFCFYQLLRNLNSDKFLFALIAFICSLGCYALILLSFGKRQKKASLIPRSN